MAASQIGGVPSANVSRLVFHVLIYALVVVKSNSNCFFIENNTSFKKIAISLAHFNIMLAAMDFSSLYCHIDHQKKIGTFVKYVTKSPLFSLKPPYY